MNRLKFSNGGQPLFLEDIKLLQENQDEILSTLLYALCKDTGIIILKGGDWDVVNEDGDVLTVRIAEGKAFVGGDIVGWNETDVSNNLDNDLYLCVQEVDEDEREFGDGVPRKCRTNKRVYFSETTENAQWYIKIFDNHKSFAEVLRGVLGFDSSGSSVPWYEETINNELVYNGFDIKLYHSPYPGGIQIKLIMSSKNESWDDEAEGVICTYPGDLATQLQGKYSPAIFIGGDGKVYSDIIEWSSEGKHLYLHGSDGEEVVHTPNGKIESQFVIYF